MKILEFKDNYRFLSNFYPCNVSYEDIIFEYVEHAYQYAKCYKNLDKTKVLSAKTVKESKFLGRTIKLRKDWDKVKEGILTDLIKQKFYKEPLKNMLLSTGTAKIIEGNMWHDNFYGNCLCDRCKNIRGKNVLGNILMEVRDEFNKKIQTESI